jgi:hypothetical protein
MIVAGDIFEALSIPPYLLSGYGSLALGSWVNAKPLDHMHPIRRSSRAQSRPLSRGDLSIDQVELGIAREP